MSFDKNVVEVVDLDPVAAGVNLEPVDGLFDGAYWVYNQANNSTGEIRYAATQYRPSEPMTGSDNIAKIRLRAKAFGTSPKNAILLSGYQAGGTRGSLLASGAETLRIFGEDVPIRAEVIQLDSLSSHADADQMLDWMRTAPKPPRITYITHGEPLSSDRLRFRVQDELKWNVKVPRDGQIVDLDR